MARRDTIRIRAPRDIMEKLRFKYPHMTDANLIRVTYGSSLMRVEMGANNLDKRLSEVLGVKKKR